MKLNNINLYTVLIFVSMTAFNCSNDKGLTDPNFTGTYILLICTPVLSTAHCFANLLDKLFNLQGCKSYLYSCTVLLVQLYICTNTTRSSSSRQQAEQYYRSSTQVLKSMKVLRKFSNVRLNLLPCTCTCTGRSSRSALDLLKFRTAAVPSILVYIEVPEGTKFFSTWYM